LNGFPTVRLQGQKGGRPVRDADVTPETNELDRLRAENARLRALLEAHGIDLQRSLAEPAAPQRSEASRLSTDEKVSAAHAARRTEPGSRTNPSAQIPHLGAGTGAQSRRNRLGTVGARRGIPV
jgi:hypothetical protein